MDSGTKITSSRLDIPALQKRVQGDTISEALPIRKPRDFLWFSNLTVYDDVNQHVVVFSFVLLRLDHAFSEFAFSLLRHVSLKTFYNNFQLTSIQCSSRLLKGLNLR